MNFYKELILRVFIFGGFFYGEVPTLHAIQSYLKEHFVTIGSWCYFCNTSFMVTLAERSSPIFSPRLYYQSTTGDQSLYISMARLLNNIFSTYSCNIQKTTEFRQYYRRSLEIVQIIDCLRKAPHTNGLDRKTGKS